MDFEFGGQNRAPKFPLPSNCSFLIGYAGYSKDASIDKYVRLTLNQMAFGGIYDQIGGGFSRYSTDMRWKVPHFEKMLYDNAQLISLYAEAFQFTGNNLYKEVATETIAFALRELQSESGLFYAAIDADSEGEEGKFYVWKKAELVQILGDLYPLAATHFNVNEIGYWEHDNYILIRTKEIVEFSKEIEAIKGRLLEERSKRKRPGTDTKLLTGWNGLIITALTKASVLLNEPTYKAEAIRAGLVLLNERVNKDGSLIRCKTSNSNAIAGFLEDYAFTIESFITLYQATFDESWIHAAENITKYAIKHFHDKDNGLFYFTGDSMEQLIARTAEIHDNVIPSSNSTMARNLYTLSLLLDQPDYKIASEKMLRNVLAQVRSYGEGYSNWCKLLLQLLTPSKQICIVGPNAKDWAEQIRPFIGSTTLLSGSNEVSNMPLLKNKFNRNKTLIYFCENTTCKAPFERIEDAIAALNNSL